MHSLKSIISHLVVVIFVTIQLLLLNIVDSCSNELRENSSYFWIVNRTPPSFILGTVHVPYELIWNKLPPHVRSAFAVSNRLLVELDMTDNVVRRALNECQRLKPNQTVRMMLQPRTYRSLRIYFINIRKNIKSIGEDSVKVAIYRNVVRNWYRKKPIWILCSLMSYSLALDKDSDSPVIDLYLAQQAKASQIPVSSLESPDHQCEALNSIENDKVDEMIEMFLNQTKNKKDTASSSNTVEEYNCGNLTLNQNFNGNEKFNTNDEKAIASSRTNYLAGRIHHVLLHRPDEILFFAIGTGHLIGNDTSVISLLEEMGHNVARVPINPSRISRFTQVLPKRWYRQASSKPKHELDEDFNDGDESRYRLYESQHSPLNLTLANPKKDGNVSGHSNHLDGSRIFMGLTVFLYIFL
ncbi:hypothetical protein ACOME3_006218 [Neoechinorhynchus agilis]